MRGFRRLGEPGRLGAESAAGGAGGSTFEVTTTGAAQTLTIHDLTVSAATDIDWGDGNQEAVTDSGLRTHEYADAGTYTVRIAQPLNVTSFDLRDSKVSSITGENISRMVNLTRLRLQSLDLLTWTVGASAPLPAELDYLRLESLDGFTWTVGASAPLPAELTDLRLLSLTGFTWPVGASAPLPAELTFLRLESLDGFTWTVGASAPLPAGLTDLYLISLDGLAAITTTFPAGLTTLVYENNMTSADVDTVLSNLYAGFPTRTGTNGSIDLAGAGNAAPNGTYQAQCPPTTGKEFAYELLNDSCTVSSNHWASITVEGGLP